ncbi:GntR family transcriptional regulator [Kribbella aluminosa]|uniref:GntR family transcriptional regulator n=1 Tax=Kribbella aluminosa TaxID=416017 RepID=A0ABS4UMY4_9ACTN|nr:GntR family transcriptional regulator [Kribbella aluminosa]MBP2353013.1 GntR family transcriptional regulator [Kribbella aluminosa]
MNVTTSRGRREARSQAPRWLRDELRAEVLSGGFAGGLLPVESDLMRIYSVPRAVVRSALDLLRREGLIERIQGTGTLAVAQKRAGRLLEYHGVIGDTATILNGASSRVLAMEVMPMPRIVARHLDEAPGTECLLLEYVGYVYGESLGIYSNYLRFPEAEAVASTVFSTHFYKLLEDAGLVIGETDFRIEALVADDLVATLLDVEAGAPLIGLEQVIRDREGRPYDYAVLRSRGDRISLISSEIRAQLPATRQDNGGEPR